VVVIGGGPAGLATAIMLARRGYTNIKVSRNERYIRMLICSWLLCTRKGSWP
jgi:thioredoxin reductase